MKTQSAIKTATVALALTFGWLLYGAAQTVQYYSGFTWQRVSDWTVEPDSYAGTTEGNPSPDSQGNPVWSYEWTEGGGGLGSADPWYMQPAQQLVWEPDWYDTGVPGWDRADAAANGVSQDYSPFIDQNQMSLNLTQDPPISSPDESPLVQWIDPVQQAFEMNIAGTLQVGWQGETGGYPVDVDLVIAQESAGGTFNVLFADTVSKPTDDTTKEFLNVPVNVCALISPGDSLIFSLEADGESSGNWITLDDGLTLTIVPEPSTLVILGMGCIALVRINRFRQPL